MQSHGPDRIPFWYYMYQILPSFVMYVCPKRSNSKRKMSFSVKVDEGFLIKLLGIQNCLPHPYISYCRNLQIILRCLYSNTLHSTCWSLKCNLLFISIYLEIQIVILDNTLSQILSLNVCIFNHYVQCKHWNFLVCCTRYACCNDILLNTDQSHVHTHSNYWNSLSQYFVVWKHYPFLWLLDHG